MHGLSVDLYSLTNGAHYQTPDGKRWEWRRLSMPGQGVLWPLSDAGPCAWTWPDGRIMRQRRLIGGVGELRPVHA